MATLYNSISIHASPEEVWQVLADMELLAQYDPVVTKSTLVSGITKGLHAKRHCETKSGWFKDEVSEWEPYTRLSFRLYDCNQPMKSLTHAYTLTEVDGKTEVKQVMRYTMKYGWLGKLMDVLMVKNVSDKQIKLFFKGLKAYVEGQKKRNPHAR